MNLQLYSLEGGILSFPQVQSISIKDSKHGSFSCYPSHIPCIIQLKNSLLRIVSKQGERTFELENGCVLIPLPNKVHITATVLRETQS